MNGFNFWGRLGWGSAVLVPTKNARHELISFKDRCGDFGVFRGAARENMNEGRRGKDEYYDDKKTAKRNSSIKTKSRNGSNT